VASADIHDPVVARTWTEAGAVAADLATAAVLAAAVRAEAVAGALLAITRAGETVLDEGGVAALEAQLGAVAMSALTAPAAGY
jgi:hypothetical protein